MTKWLMVIVVSLVSVSKTDDKADFDASSTVASPLAEQPRDGPPRLQRPFPPGLLKPGTSEWDLEERNANDTDQSSKDSEDSAAKPFINPGINNKLPDLRPFLGVGDKDEDSETGDNSEESIGQQLLFPPWRPTLKPPKTKPPFWDENLSNLVQIRINKTWGPDGTSPEAELSHTDNQKDWLNSLSGGVNWLRRGIQQMFGDTGPLFTSDAFSRVFPPKLRQAVAGTMEDIISSFKDERLQNVCKKLMPAHSEDQEDMGFNFTLIPQSHVRRVIRDIGRLPSNIQDKLIGINRSVEMTPDEIRRNFPVNVFPTFTKKKFDELRLMTSEQKSAVCKRLLRVSSTPWNLQAAISGGMDCFDSIKELTSTARVFSKSQGQVLMNFLRRLGNGSFPRDSKFVTSLFTKFGSAMTSDDILLLPTEVFKESLSNITATRLPYKSQRRALLKKIQKDYGSPTAWPDTILEKISGLVDDMDMYEISLFRKDYVEKAAESLSMRMGSVGKRLAVAKYMGSSTNRWQNSMDTDSIKRGFPWLKCDRNYLDNLNLTNLQEVLNTRRILTDDMLPGEVSFLAERLQTLPQFLEISNITSEEVDSFGQLLDGFDITFFDKLSEDVILNSKAIPRMNFTSKAKVRAILERIKDVQGVNNSSVPLGNLFRGLGLADVEKLYAEEMITALRSMDELNMDRTLARKVMRKIIDNPDHGSINKTGCLWNRIEGLDNLIQHIPTRMITDQQLFDPSQIMSEERTSGCIRKNRLTKAQFYAFFDTIKERFGTISSENSIYDSDFFDSIGNLVLGMTGDDIENLPEDTELLTIIEILSDYEDEMDSSQVEAIAEKIRQYFDIGNRNDLEEVTTVTVSQIGRFLQYLDVKMDLPKFPRHLRMDMAKEIGRSKMNKISLGKQNQLLKFALRYTIRADGTSEDLTRAESLDEVAIQDLGYLRCGMLSDEIQKLTSKAIDENLEDLQLCPFKVSEAKALIRRALDLNTNRIRRRELLVGLGALLPYISEEEMYIIDEEEIASVSEYIVKLIAAHEKEIDIRENNGFIRERTVADKQERDNGKNSLRKRLKHALTAVTKSGSENDCHIMRSLGNSLHNAFPTTGFTFNNPHSPCSDEIGNLPSWLKTAARRSLKAVAESITDIFELSSSLPRLTSENIKRNAGLIKGLTPIEMKLLNLKDSEVMAAIGKFSDYTPEQLLAGFERWKELQGTSSVSVDDILALNNFVCGMTAELISSMVSPAVVKETVDELGRLKTCDPQRLEALAAKLTHEDGFGPSAKQWKIYDISAAGHIVGGLPAEQLAGLRTVQLHAIAPETILNMPVEKVKEFSADQLASFTTNQKNAITSMQRSYMTEEQMKAIGLDMHTNGGESKFSKKVFGCLSVILIFSQINYFLD